MKVSELIEILSKLDSELRISTHANNHSNITYKAKDYDGTKVSLIEVYTGEKLVMIGDQSRKQIGGNAKVLHQLDGKKELLDNWR